MGVLKRIVVGSLFVFMAILGLGAVWLWARPPELLRLGDGYAAKIVCSNVFIAGRDPEDVLAVDVQAPGNPLLKLIHVDVDKTHRRVTASFFGFLAPSYAIYRGRYGCATVPDGDFAAAERALPFAPSMPHNVDSAQWPDGEGAIVPDRNVQASIEDPVLAGSGIRGLIVVHGGRILGETYGPGFGARTPLLGWSMTKTVNAAMIGLLMQDGRMSFEDSRLFDEWKGDDRAKIRLADLMAMQSGLDFDESYGLVTDTTRMLYLDRDMVVLPRSKPLILPPGNRFSYSSGSAVLLSRLWMNRIASSGEALAFPQARLFDALGMRSAVFEADMAGTYAGSSYLYATARDWARFGQFLLQDGVWRGRRLLPEEFMRRMRTLTQASNGIYGGAQAWLAPSFGQSNQEAGLPADTIWMLGHDGQSVAIVPSADLVVVRLGLTPSMIGYQPQALVGKIIEIVMKKDAAQ